MATEVFDGAAVEQLDGSVKGSLPVIISASSRPVTGPSVKP